MKYGVLPLLFGFLLLGAGQAANPGRVTRQAAPPAAPPHPAPRLLRTADEMHLEPILPLPVYVVQPDDLQPVVIET